MAGNNKKPTKVVKAEKNRWLATIEGWADFYNWLAGYIFNIKGKDGIKVDDTYDDKLTLKLDQETCFDIISGNAFRYVNGSLVDCVFVYDGETYNIGDQRAGTGKHYLHIDTDNPSSSHVSSSSSASGNEIVVPLCEIGVDDEVVHSWLGCPVVGDGGSGSGTSTYWWYDSPQKKLRGCTVFLGAGGYRLSVPDVTIPAATSNIYANVTFGQTPTLALGTSAQGDFSVLVCSVSDGKVRALNSIVVLPCWG